jgi:hypothetical protein
MLLRPRCPTQAGALKHERRRSWENTPQWARTTNLRFRRPMLYPIELGVREKSCRPPDPMPFNAANREPPNIAKPAEARNPIRCLQIGPKSNQGLVPTKVQITFRLCRQ